VHGIVAVGDALCHTDPAFAYGVSFALEHARLLAQAASSEGRPDAVAESYRQAAAPEAHERYELACATDEARSRRWAGEPLEIAKRDGCYPLFSFAAALAAAPHDDLVLRRTVGRIGLLDRTEVFDTDDELHARIESILADLRPVAPGPPRAELLARLNAKVPSGV
jgi:flavin-dependent dehydrogenase